MNKFIILFLALCSTCKTNDIIEAEDPDSNKSTDDFFESAWEYQDLITDLQEEINQRIIDIQTAVSTVLKKSTNETLTQYEQHVYAILALDQPIRDALEELEANTSCRTLLEQNLIYTTNMTGFESSNCAASYDSAIADELSQTNAAIKNDNDFNGDVQQFVVKSFVGINAFMTPEAITAKYENFYNTAKANWDMAKPDVDTLVSEMETLIAAMNINLGRCHKELIDLVTQSYETLNRNVGYCEDFESDNADSASDTQTLPQEMIDFIKNFPKFIFDWNQGE
ncbi:unnamed protein product [Diamesa serratosioi]